MVGGQSLQAKKPAEATSFELADDLGLSRDAVKISLPTYLRQICRGMRKAQ